MQPEDLDALAWARSVDARAGGLLPAIVQHADDQRVLMLGWMSREALLATLDSGWVTFHSRSRGNLWTKGETSGHRLALVSIAADCDRDALLVQARPQGPTCHLARTSCFEHVPASAVVELDAVVAARMRDAPRGSYTASLLAGGTARIAQKVGEEGVEAALAGVVGSDEALLGEAADLLYHLLVLLRARGLGWSEVEAVLRERRAQVGPPDDAVVSA
ncbi:MAG: bifunctional phosphoribosyl-AMP cyclohydrolase/phosphoribosyl-ATP diphosphatase HisIE [Lysobacteraceae bacterium]|nr:MAG: bifunctional phosphoribosyl-AMP cyclohydrolase/phosphoribosyl-ATP diphosphatase HisIE [Xanthomonadaceae bacterium]